MDIDGLLLLACLHMEECVNIASLCVIRRHLKMGSRSPRPLLSSDFIAFTFIIHFYQLSNSLILTFI